MAEKKPSGKKTIISNRKARFHYEILDTWEAGMELKGPEVKSLRAGDTSFEGAFARVEDGQLFLKNLYIGRYKMDTGDGLEDRRDRKLLLHRREINKILKKTEGTGLTIVPLELYFRNGWAKVSVGLARGKKNQDKRESLKKKAQSRELERSFKGKFRV